MKKNAKDAYYFPHDANAKDDFKCTMLIETLGLEGYGAFWILIEVLRDQPTYSYPMSLLNSVARKYNTTVGLLEDVIKNYNLFIIKEDSMFYSESFSRRMAKVDKMRSDAIKGGQASAKKRKDNAEKLKRLEQMYNLSSTPPQQSK